MQLHSNIRRSLVCVLCASFVMLTLSASVLDARDAAGNTSAIVLPNGPAKPGFDVTRLTVMASGTFEAFHVSATQSLREALKSRVIANDTDLLVTDTAGGPLALIVEQMAYHHIAQGRANGQDWLVSFCVVCNTGTRLVPIANGKAARFETAGFYDGMLVMRDVATGTIWNHITGDALYGPAVGTTLGPVGNVLQMTAKQLFEASPEARVAISDRISRRLLASPRRLKRSATPSAATKRIARRRRRRTDSW